MPKDYIDELPFSEKRKEIYRFYKLTFDEDGCPMKQTESGMVFHPLYPAYLIADYLDLFSLDKDLLYLHQILDLVKLSVKRTSLLSNGNAMCFVYDNKQNLSYMRHSFYSSLTQSHYIKCIARILRLTKQYGIVDSSIDLSDILLKLWNSLLINVDDGGVLLKKDFGWVAEEYPSEIPLYTLNGWATVMRNILSARSLLNDADIDCTEYIEQNLRALIHLLPLYDAEFCYNTKYNLSGFSRIRCVFSKKVEYSFQELTINIPDSGTFPIYDFVQPTRWSNYVERKEDRLFQCNIVRSLISYPLQNEIHMKLKVSDDCVMKVYYADGDYNPDLSAAPTQRWIEFSQLNLKADCLIDKTLNIPFDDRNIFAYPTNFNKKIGVKHYNVYHFVHIIALAEIYKHTKIESLKKYSLKWLEYTKNWNHLEFLQDKKYSIQQHNDLGMEFEVKNILGVEDRSELLCPFCKGGMTGEEEKGRCSHCSLAARVRTIEDLVQDFILPNNWKELSSSNKLGLCFSTTSHERKFLEPLNLKYTSVSLFGKYGANHVEGVDARDLSRYQDSSFILHYSCLLFDYFVEHESAIKEAYRVLDAGGLFITHIEWPRIKEGNSPPEIVSTITPKKGYYEYIPEGQGMVNIKVGREWFIEEMKKAGFEVMVYKIKDKFSDLICEWFVGQKIAKEAKTSKALSTTDTTSWILSKSYSIPLPAGFSHSRIEIDISTIDTTKKSKTLNFACHVIDENGHATNDLICTGVGGFLLSKDLGESWKWFLLNGCEGVNFTIASTHLNCIHLIAKGYSPKLSENPDTSGLLVVVDNEGDILSKSVLSKAQWHGTDSIDYEDKALMFADYQLNLPVNSDDDKAKRLSSNVFKTLDSGKTWKNILSIDGKFVRHFHTLRKDPYSKNWYLTSGDLSDECRLWSSSDCGETWTEIHLHNNCHKSTYRMTSMTFSEDGIFWGSDDIMGSVSKLDENIAIADRSGSRIFFAKREDLSNPIEIGWVGQPVRSIVDVGEYWIVLTQGSMYRNLSRPLVYLLEKKSPYKLIKMFEIDKYDNANTGFTYSRHSRIAKDGVFFTYRGPNDLVTNNPHKILKWKFKTFEE